MRIWYCLTSPPKISTWATPWTFCMRTRNTRSASRRSSIVGTVSEVRPIIASRLIEAVMGTTRGGSTPRGRRAPTSGSRSTTLWRAARSSVPSSKMAVTTLKPGMEEDRSVWSRAVPPNAASMGTLTSRSTSSADRPGASVWTVTCAGANSGNTSHGARRTARPPAISSPAADSTTTHRRCREW